MILTFPTLTQFLVNARFKFVCQGCVKKCPLRKSDIFYQHSFKKSHILKPTYVISRPNIVLSCAIDNVFFGLIFTLILKVSNKISSPTHNQEMDK